MPSSSCPSIMLVDDEGDILILYQNFLKKAGFNAVTFADPLLALEHFKQYPHKYSVVVTDLRMPNLDGLSLISHLRSLNEHVKTLLVTAYFREDLISNPEFNKARINGILQKPFDFSVKNKDYGDNFRPNRLVFQASYYSW